MGSMRCLHTSWTCHEMPTAAERCSLGQRMRAHIRACTSVLLLRLRLRLRLLCLLIHSRLFRLLAVMISCAAIGPRLICSTAGLLGSC